ncbi:baculoviral IAP repeat-containing protein 7 [Porphyrio hochstetteri]
MGDMTPAEEAELRDAYSQLFESSMRSEARRLRTFWHWPGNSPVSAHDLVKAGFFFVGPRDEVQCFCCGGVLKDWIPGDCPAAEHLKFFPSCKFICGEDVGNQEMLPLQEVFDMVDGQFLSFSQGIESEEAALSSEPEYPEMEEEEVRLSTFRNWPQDTNVPPEQLARAGFFYTGQDDTVRCFFCDGGVRRWSFGLDPWRQHAKWYPGCEFLLRSRGREFVSSIQESSPSTLLSPLCESNFTYLNFQEQLMNGNSSTKNWTLPLYSGLLSNALRSLDFQALPPLDQYPIAQNVLQMGFDPIWVLSLVENKYMLTGTCYLSESELISDLLQLDWEESKSAEESRGAAQRQTKASSSREEMQSVQQKESASWMSTEQQLRRLQEEKMCKVCMDRDVSVVFVPCGHLVACGECAINLKLCPICRAVIEGSVKTFMS